MSPLRARLGLEAASEQLELGLVVLSDEVQFAVAQGQPFFIPKWAIATIIAMAACGAPREARFRFLPGTLQLMILGDEVQFAVPQSQPLLVPRAHSRLASRAWSRETIRPRPLTPEWAKLGDEVQLAMAKGLPSLIWTLLASLGRGVGFRGHSGAPGLGVLYQEVQLAMGVVWRQPLVLWGPIARFGGT